MGRHSDREGKSAKGSADRARHGVQRIALLIRQIVLAAVLVAVGVSLGIVAGTVSDLPDLLFRRMQEQPEVVDLDFDDTDSAEFPAVAGLQEPAADTPDVAPAYTPLLDVDPPAPAQVSAAPTSEPAPLPARSAADSAEKLIAAIAHRRPSGSASSPRGNVVQVASYRDRRAADALSSRLKRHGFEAFVSTLVRGGEQRYRVRVRPTAGIGEEAVAAQLAERGFSVWVTRE